jgi:hypothetical protein
MVLRTIIILSVLLSSCSADWHIKRALKKDPSIYKSAIVKTHLDSFTVITGGVKVDTIFKYENLPQDTFIMERDKFKTVVITDTLFKTLFVETECYPDTIEVVREIPVTVLQPIVDERTWWEKKMEGLGKFLFPILLVLIVLLILRFVIKNAK